MCTLYCGLLLDTEVLVVWTKSVRENKSSWKPSLRAPNSSPAIHLPQIWLATPNRSQPKAFKGHHCSACMRQNKSKWAKLPGKINFYLGLPRVSICLQSGQGNVLVGTKSHLQSVNHLTLEQTSEACLILVLWNCSLLSRDQKGKVEKPDQRKKSSLLVP